MRYRKVYGKSKESICPFCGSIATTKNQQGIPTCRLHNKEELNDLKCSCGEWLDLKIGKYGPFFTCLNCGIISYDKALDMNNYPLKNIEEI